MKCEYVLIYIKYNWRKFVCRGRSERAGVPLSLPQSSERLEDLLTSPLTGQLTVFFLQ